jgi:PKD repeat protein
VNFSSAGSNDPDGFPLTYLWDFGDGTGSTEANPAHTFTTTATQRYDVRLTVTDAGNATAQGTVAVFVNHTLPSATILSPVDGTKFLLTGDTEYLLTRRVVETAGHPTTTTWSVFLHHNDHEHPQTPVVATEALATISPAHSTTESFSYRVHLAVVDDLGATVQRDAWIFPNATNEPPQLAWSAALKSRLRSPAPQIVDSGATAADPDSPGIEFGELRVSLTGGLAGDLLSIVPDGNGAGQVNVSGSNVSLGGVPVGVITSGTGAQPLSVFFNTAATPAAAQAILRRIGATFSRNGKRILAATLSDGDGGTSAAATRTMTVGTNLPPTITLTSPANGGIYTRPAAIPLAANAVDADGNVVRVEFLNGGRKIGESTTAPHHLVWSGTSRGSYIFRARAIDDMGATTTSKTVTVTVK